MTPSTAGDVARDGAAFAGLLLTGGPDVDPARYGAAPEAGVELHPDPARDALDLALLERAALEGWPVLAVCYGIQLLNVFHGGTFVQDLDSRRQGRAPGARSERSPRPRRDAPRRSLAWRLPGRVLGELPPSPGDRPARRGARRGRRGAGRRDRGGRAARRRPLRPRRPVAPREPHATRARSPSSAPSAPPAPPAPPRPDPGVCRPDPGARTPEPGRVASGARSPDPGAS